MNPLLRKGYPPSPKAPEDRRLGGAEGDRGRVEKCNGHFRYDDKRAAKTALNERMRQHNRPDGLEIYACPTCGGWHMKPKKL